VASPDVTALLRAWAAGDGGAFDQLVPIVHRELHRIARICMAAERTGHTLQPTALINEAYLRLVGIGRVDWQDRAHFFATSARLMRRILVDIARTKGALKRGAGIIHMRIDAPDELAAERPPDLIALDLALDALAQLDDRKSRVVELRFFGGLTVEETAEALHISPETVHRDWRVAKAWLRRELRKDSRGGD
jgi:RNA polymerase sigma factor (TIGR02999 family)